MARYKSLAEFEAALKATKGGNAPYRHVLTLADGSERRAFAWRKKEAGIQVGIIEADYIYKAEDFFKLPQDEKDRLGLDSFSTESDSRAIKPEGGMGKRAAALIGAKLEGSINAMKAMYGIIPDDDLIATAKKLGILAEISKAIPELEIEVI